jgi:hypothetical protein
MLRETISTLQGGIAIAGSGMQLSRIALPRASAVLVRSYWLLIGRSGWLALAVATHL